MQEIRFFTAEKARELSLVPKRDALAFVQMERILAHGLPLVLSDGEQCLIVQSDALSPVWVWIRSDTRSETMEGILLSLSALREQRRLSSLITNNRLAPLIAIAFQKEITKKRTLMVYQMKELHPFTAEGRMVKGAEVPSAQAGAMIAALAAADGETLSLQMQRDMGIAFSQSENAFAWKTAEGEVASIAKVAPVGERFSDIHTVFTCEEHRNRGYGKALISGICEGILHLGRTPMLYADRENAAANHVYRELGFLEKGKLTAFHLAGI